MADDSIKNLEKRLITLKDTLNKYKKECPIDLVLINEIEKKIFENKEEVLKKEKYNNLKDNIETLKEHQTYTAIAIHPFLEINGKTAISNHHLIAIDPFVSLKDKSIKKIFDALILNIEKNCNKLIFLETKSSYISKFLLKDVISKIEFYESYQMQEDIRNYFKMEHNITKIDYIEYVLLVQPETNNLVREKLKNKNIIINKNDGSQESIPIPLIIWNIIRSPKPDRFNYYYLLYQPFNADINEGIKLRQQHRNKKLIKYLNKKEECDVTQLLTLKFSPVLDNNYQLIMVTIELIKIYGKIFKKEELEEILWEQLPLNLKKQENMDYLYNKIINKGIKAEIFIEKEKNKEFEIKLRKIMGAYLIEEEIIEKLVKYKVEKEMNKPETKLDLIKKIILNYMSDSRRKGKTLDPFIFKKEKKRYFKSFK